MPTIEQTRRPFGDLVIREWDHLHSREGCVLVNAGATALEAVNVFGLPVKNLTRLNDDAYSAEIAMAGDEADVEGIVVYNEKVTFAASGDPGDTTTKRYPVVVRGPVVLNKDEVRALDPDEAAYDRDAIAVALAARPGAVVLRAEPNVVHTW